MIDLAAEPYAYMEPKARANKFGDIGRAMRKAASQANSEKSKRALRAYAADCFAVEAAILKRG